MANKTTFKFCIVTMVLYLIKKSSVESSIIMYLASSLKDNEIESISMQTWKTDPGIRTAQDDIQTTQISEVWLKR